MTKKLGDTYGLVSTQDAGKPNLQNVFSSPSYITLGDQYAK